MAIINETHTRLNADDLDLWKAAGLQLGDMGLVISSNNGNGPADGDRSRVEVDMLTNALVWLLAKLSNFIAAGENFIAGLESENHASSALCVSQQTLRKRWKRLKLELQVWHERLPEMFAPCARVTPSSPDLRDHFSEVWYSMPMCASAMQNYHMAQILLLINKPHESTARQTTVIDRLRNCNSIATTTGYHAREICGISLSRLEGSAHVPFRPTSFRCWKMLH